MKRTALALILTLLFSVVAGTQFNVGYATESPADVEEVLVFLRDVGNVDVGKYEAHLVGTSSGNPPELGGILEVTGKYTLVSEESTINVLFMFRDDTFCYCLIKVVEGEIHQLEELPADINGQADFFLQRYQEYTGDSTIEAMRIVLHSVDATENGEMVIGNVKLEVSVDPFSTLLSWKNTFNGADYTSLGVDFRNGTFVAFGDDRSYYTIGGTDVNLSEEDAVDLALRHAKDLWWKVPNGTVVTDFTIVENEIGAELLTRPREVLTLYPYWLVILPLDKMYPGFVTQIMFLVWADTGEVIECSLLGQGGDVPVDVIPSNQQDETPEPTPKGILSNQFEGFLIMVIIVAVCIVGAGLIVYFKKRKR